MKYDKADAKDLILTRWKALSASERTAQNASNFAMQAAKEYHFGSASAHAVIRLWLVQELGCPPRSHSRQTAMTA